MPTFSIYLDDETINSIKNLAEARNLPVSRIVREALAGYLRLDDQTEARQRVMETLQSRRPLGPATEWTAIHLERTAADADRA